MPDLRPVPRPDVAVQVDGEGAYLLDPVTAEYYELNRTGRRIWDLLAGGATEAEAAARLCEEFAVDEATARAAVADLVRDLTSADLITPGGRPPGRLGRWWRSWRRARRG